VGREKKDARRRQRNLKECTSAAGLAARNAYGTLNHLNAHVTLQSHGIKRRPEGKVNYFLTQIANLFL